MKKNNRGITLTSLLIYVIGMTIAIGTIATLTSFFYSNVNVEGLNDDTTTQFSEFTNLMLNEISKTNNSVVDCKTDENDGKISYIIFSSGNQYTFKNNSIYKNNIKICNNVEDCEFSYKFIDSQYKIKINFKTANIDMTQDKALVYMMK